MEKHSYLDRSSKCFGENFPNSTWELLLTNPNYNNSFTGRGTTRLLLRQQRYIEESINITLLYKMTRYLYYRSFLTSSLMYLLFPKGGHSKKEKEKEKKGVNLQLFSITFFFSLLSY